MGEHTYLDKRLAYENSMRVPLLIRYPKLIKKGTEIDEQCLNIDIAPTILDIANVEIPKYMQGESMKKLLKGKHQRKWRKKFCSNTILTHIGHMLDQIRSQLGLINIS